MNYDILMLLWVMLSTFVIYLLFRRPIKDKNQRLKKMSYRQKQLFLILLSFVFTTSMMGMIEFFDIILRLVF